MHRGSRCNKDYDAPRIKMQQGLRCNEDQDASRIKMQRGSRYNQDKDEARINMQRGHIVLRGPLSFALFTLSSVTNIITFSLRLLMREAIASLKIDKKLPTFEKSPRWCTAAGSQCNSSHNHITTAMMMMMMMVMMMMMMIMMMMLMIMMMMVMMMMMIYI